MGTFGVGSQPVVMCPWLVSKMYSSCNTLFTLKATAIIGFWVSDHQSHHTQSKPASGTPKWTYHIRYRVSRCLSLHCKLSLVQCVFLEPLGYSASCAKFTERSGFVSLINWDLQVWNFEGRMMMNHSSLPDFFKTNPKKSHPLLTAPDHRKLPPFVEGLIWCGFNRFWGSAQPQEMGI